MWGAEFEGNERVSLGHTQCTLAPDIRTSPRMKPVLILQHLSADDPAWFGTWAAAAGCALRGAQHRSRPGLPTHLREHSALAVLGGEMSANDPLPSLRRAEALIGEAMAAGQP